MTKKVDSYRFINFITKKLVKNWIKREEPREIPWTPLTKPLSEAKIALVSTAGIALKTDQPFDQEGERKKPWWGDPSFRVIPREATEEDVGIYHLHIDTSHGEKDLNCLLPLKRLQELEESGEIGESAPSHYSFMGYITEPEELIEKHTPPIIEKMKQEDVDVVILVPA